LRWGVVHASRRAVSRPSCACGRSVSAPGPIALSIVRARLARRFKSRRMCHQDGSSLRPLSISLCAHRLHGSAADEYKSGLCRSDAVGTQGERSGRGAPAAALLRVSVFSTKTYERQFLDAANAVAGHSLGYLKSRLTLQTAIAAEGSKAIFVFVNDVLDRHVLQNWRSVGSASPLCVAPVSVPRFDIGSRRTIAPIFQPDRTFPRRLRQHNLPTGPSEGPSRSSLSEAQLPCGL
jgi:hypothetical protein